MTDHSDMPVLINKPKHWVSGVIFGSPHSGSIYPDWFMSGTRLSKDIVRSSEDAFVDQFIENAPEFGAATIQAQVPRCIVDLNRGADEIDPLVVRGVPRHPLNQRTLAGLGVIPRVVSQGRTIHDRPIDRHEAERRINTYWRPYHQTLTALIAEARARFGQAILIDMHSMPADALNHLGDPRPDIVLGNRHGLSASARVTEAVIAATRDEGWKVRVNSPFSGAYICSAYGRPGRNVHVVQLEINRALYMDEKAIKPLPDFDRFVTKISRVVRSLAAFDSNAAADSGIAAE